MLSDSIRPSLIGTPDSSLLNLSEFVATQNGTLREVFNSLDTSATGVLTADVFVEGLRHMGYQGDVEGAFRAMCPPGAPGITLQDFLLTVSPKLSDQSLAVPLVQRPQGIQKTLEESLGRAPDDKARSSVAMSEVLETSIVKEQLNALHTELLRMQTERQEQHQAVLQTMESYKQKDSEALRHEMERAVGEMSLRVDLELQQVRKELTLRGGATLDIASVPEGGHIPLSEIDEKVEAMRQNLESRLSKVEASLSTQVDGILQEQRNALIMARRAFDLATEVNSAVVKQSHTSNHQAAELKADVKAQVDEIWKNLRMEASKNAQLSKNLLARLQGVVSKMENSYMESIDALSNTRGASSATSEEGKTTSRPLSQLKAQESSSPTSKQSQSGLDTPVSAGTASAGTDAPTVLSDSRVLSGQGQGFPDPTQQVAAQVVDLITSLRLEVLNLHDTDMEICEQALKESIATGWAPRDRVAPPPAAAFVPPPVTRHSNNQRLHAAPGSAETRIRSPASHPRLQSQRFEQPDGAGTPIFPPASRSSSRSFNQQFNPGAGSMKLPSRSSIGTKSVASDGSRGSDSARPMMFSTRSPSPVKDTVPKNAPSSASAVNNSTRAASPTWPKRPPVAEPGNAIPGAALSAPSQYAYGGHSLNRSPSGAATPSMSGSPGVPQYSGSSIAASGQVPVAQMGPRQWSVVRPSVNANAS